ncbi:Tetraspanin family, putative [Trypanosoma equiperdum]|uniref:Tetraspanin family, putative n=1 Tax=Trypanosoma equiperdum TaxID=5694 RepID=A0A1G4IGW3_TRYEQ|nr:Tetraspanin family, putative [Trypanosoma equiperdum]
MAGGKLLDQTEPAQGYVRGPDAYAFRNDDYWSSSMYVQVEEEEVESGCCRSCGVYCCCSSCFSFFFILLGATLCLPFVVWGLFPMAVNWGDHWSLFKVVLLCTGVFNLLLGVVGIFSVYFKSKMPSMLFSVMLMASAVPVLSLGLLFLLLLMDILPLDTMLSGVWREAVQEQPELICNIQANYKCSGFEKGRCCFSNATRHIPGIRPHVCYLVSRDGHVMLDPITLEEITWPKLYCSPVCGESNIYRDTCGSRIVEDTRPALPATVGALMACGFILLLLSAVALRRARRPRESPLYFQYEY